MSATVRSASINLLNTIIGAGILAMPYGLKSNGIVLGLFVIILSASCSSFGLYLQSKCSRYAPTGHASFFALSQMTYPSLSVIFDLAIAVKCFGVGVSYLVVIGDLMPKIVDSLFVVAESSWLLNRNIWISFFMFTVVIPLSFLRKLDSLKYTSIVALTSVTYLIVLVVEHFISRDIPLTPEDRDISIWKPYSVSSMISSFPIFVFAYTCHQNMFSLINELKDKSSKSMNSVISIAIGTAMTSYVVVGLTGYLTFGNTVGGNIIVMYPKSISSTVGRIAIVVLVMLSFPLQCHPCRASINHVLHSIKRANRKPEEELLRDEQSIQNSVEERRLLVQAEERPSAQTDSHGAVVVPLGTKKFISITAVIVTLSYVTAMTVQSLEHVLSVVGSTGSTSISFILPGVFAYTLIGSEKYEIGEPLTKKELTLKYGGLVLSIWGFIVMIVCLSATIFLGATH